MSQKYLPDRPPPALPRIITSDVYCAACLLSLGCTLDKVVRNDRRRVAFVFEGERVRELKRAYKGPQPVYVEANAFRDSIITIRRLVDQSLSQRSDSCPQLPLPLSASPMRSSAA
jgi:hypothetical protein